MRARYVDLTVEEDTVGVVTIENPPRNSLTRHLLGELIETLRWVPETKVRAVVLTGGPRCFSAGVDTEELKQIEERSQAEDLLRKGQELIRRLEGSPVPVLAAVGGVCLGGGLELALACHVRYSCETAVFGFPELSLGIIPAFGGMRLLLKSVGYGRSVELLLRGSMLNAKEARDLGIVEGVFPRSDLLSGVLRIAKGIARKNPHAVRLILESLRDEVRKSRPVREENDKVLTTLLASSPPRSFVASL